MKTASCRTWSLALGLFLVASAALGQSVSSHPEVDKLFEAWDRKDSPGCVVLVRQDGKTVHEHAYGMANLEQGVPLSLTTVFLLASVSKQFVVFAIMLLAQGGRLSLDDDVRKHVPELPEFSKTITIRHLIHHTSGLREDLTLFNLAGWRSGDAITRDDVLRLVKNQKSLNFEPGAEYSYCNTGYHLLAIIVERVGKRPFPEFARESIFEPLQMKSTVVRDNHRTLIPNLAVPYGALAKVGFDLRRIAHDPPGASNVHSTVGDLARWDQNFYDGKVGGLKLLEAMQVRAKLNDGKTIAYAGGLTIGVHRGLKTVAHTGSHGGYKTVLLRFPEQRCSVIVLANQREVVPIRLAKKVADIVLKDKMTPRPTPPEEVKVASSALDACVGEYRLGNQFCDVRKTKEGLVVRIDGGEKKRLVPMSDAKFFDREDDARYHFEQSKDGMTLRFTSGTQKLSGSRVRYLDLSPEEAKAYAGRYLSEELDSFGDIVTRDGKLYLRLPKGEMLLRSVAKDEFLAKAGDAFFSSLTLRFSRNASGQPIGHSLTTERVRNVRYDRVRIEK